MKSNKIFKISLSVLFALPLSLLFGNQSFANPLSDSINSHLNNENLIACGGGGGNSMAAKKKKKKIRARGQLSFLERKLSKDAANGIDTSETEAKIAELKALLAELKSYLRINLKIIFI